MGFHDFPQSPSGMISCLSGVLRYSANMYPCAPGVLDLHMVVKIRDKDRKFKYDTHEGSQHTELTSC